MRVRPVIGLALVMIATLLAWGTANAADPPGVLRLVEPINPITLKEPFKVVVRPTEPITDAAQVTVFIYPALRDRADVGKPDVTKGQNRQSQQSLAMSRMGRTTDGDFIVEFPVTADSKKANRDHMLLVRGPGVYPVLIELTDGKAASQQLWSYLTVLSDPTEKAPLDVSVAVPIDAPLSLQPDGSRTFAPGDLDRLDQLATVLAAYPNVPITVVPTPETMVGLNRDASTRSVWSNLQSAIGNRTVVAPPYVAMDPGAFVGTGVADEVTRQLTAGNEALASLMPGRVDAQTYFADTWIDDQTAVTLQSDRVNHVVLDPANLEKGEAATTTVVGLANLAGPSPRVIAASTSTMHRFMLTSDSAQARTELWADLALAWLDNGVGVVLVARDLPTLNPTKLDALVGALGGATRFAQMVSLDTLYTDAATSQTRGDEPTDRLLPPQTENLGSYPDRISEARFRETAITSMLPAGDPRRTDLAERLLVTSRRGLTEQQRSDYLSAVQQRLDEVVSCITPPRDDRLSVFSESSDLPVVITNRCDTALTITMRLSSDRLDFPKESSRTVTMQPNETLREEFQVRVRTAGPIPVNIELLTPTPIPLRLGQPSHITVSSGAVSGIGIALSVVAGGLLSLWWIIHFRDKRRARVAHRTALADAR